jgi:hypothetical protein
LLWFFAQYDAQVAALYAAIGSGGGTGSDAHYTYTQTTPAAAWNVAHMLGKFPSVDVVDTGGNEILTDVDYVDANHVTISFSNATAGKAYMN